MPYANLSKAKTTGKGEDYNNVTHKYRHKQHRGSHRLLQNRKLFRSEERVANQPLGVITQRSAAITEESRNIQREPNISNIHQVNFHILKWAVNKRECMILHVSFSII